MTAPHTVRALRALVVSAMLVLVPADVSGQVSPGFRAFGAVGGTDTYLMDTNATIVQTWPSAFEPGLAAYVLPDGSLLRTIRTLGGPNIGGTGGGVQRLGLTGTVLWDFRYDVMGQHWSHHDVAALPNGNVLMVAFENKSAAAAIAAGRDPALIQGTFMRLDHVIEVQPTGPATGTIVWEWHVFDHLVQGFDPTKANYGVVAAHPELIDFNHPALAFQSFDFNHVNSIDYDPVHDWVVLSAHQQNEVWVIDHGTTTAQAAGHTGGARGKGGDLLYRWGNPQAYGAGTSADQRLFGQHCAKVIRPGLPGAGNLLVFNNNHPGGSQVWELVLPVDQAGDFLPPAPTYGPAGPVWSYAAPGFFSLGLSSSERLPNGNTLICSGGQRWVFEVTPAGQVVWSYVLPTAQIFNAQYVDRSLWSNQAALSGSAGGSVGFDLIAGSPRAGLSYLLLASASGTSPGIPVNGLVVPLNWDDVLLFTFQNANTPLLSQTLGTLDPLGRGTASLNLPAGMIAGPAAADFAFVVVDPATLLVTAASNAVTLAIGP